MKSGIVRPSLVSILALFLLLPAGRALAIAVKSSAPKSVKIVAGGKPVDIRLRGNDLDGVEATVVIEGDEAIRGADAKVVRSSETEVRIQLSVASSVRPGRYAIRLTRGRASATAPTAVVVRAAKESSARSADEAQQRESAAQAARPEQGSSADRRESDAEVERERAQRRAEQAKQQSRTTQRESDTEVERERAQRRAEQAKQQSRTTQQRESDAEVERERARRRAEQAKQQSRTTQQRESDAEVERERAQRRAEQAKQQSRTTQRESDAEVERERARRRAEQARQQSAKTSGQREADAQPQSDAQRERQGDRERVRRESEASTNRPPPTSGGRVPVRGDEATPRRMPAPGNEQAEPADQALHLTGFAAVREVGACTPLDVPISVAGGSPPYQVSVDGAGSWVEALGAGSDFEVRFPGAAAGNDYSFDVAVQDAAGATVNAQTTIRVRGALPALELQDASINPNNGERATSFLLSYRLAGERLAPGSGPPGDLGYNCGTQIGGSQGVYPNPELIGVYADGTRYWIGPLSAAGIPPAGIGVRTALVPQLGRGDTVGVRLAYDGGESSEVRVTLPRTTYQYESNLISHGVAVELSEAVFQGDTQLDAGLFGEYEVEPSDFSRASDLQGDTGCLETFARFKEVSVSGILGTSQVASEPAAGSILAAGNMPTIGWVAEGPQINYRVYLTADLYAGTCQDRLR